MILSGMTTPEDIDDNAAAISAGTPLTEEEFAAIGRVREILQAEQAVKCTACRYCVKGCPMDIPIPEIFSAYNTQKRYGGWNSRMYYSNSVRGKGRASACVGCGACEDRCPYNLPIRQMLKTVAQKFGH